MPENRETFEINQERFCRDGDYVFHPTKLDSITGYAVSTEGKLPINGLRHPAEGETSGWYIWYGEELSQADDFFLSLHSRHLSERCPEIVKLLGLPPGYRFLLTPDHLDIWYDDSLIDI